MSWQATEAVLNHSALTSTQYAGLMVMVAIASYADERGVAGAGGRCKSPAISSIAKKARCSKQTVINWLPKLEATGELTVTRNGKGRGSWNAYTINLPMELVEQAPRFDSPHDDEAQANSKDKALPLDESNGKAIGLPLKDPRVDLMVKQMDLMVKQMEVMVKQSGSYGKAQGLPDPKDPIDPIDPTMSESSDEKIQVEKLFEDFKAYCPNRPKPNKTPKQLAKAKTRLKSQDFRLGYLSALKKAGASDYLHGSRGWNGFDFMWFVKDDENWRKILNGNYDNPKKSLNGKPAPKKQTEFNPEY